MRATPENHLPGGGKKKTHGYERLGRASPQIFWLLTPWCVSWNRWRQGHISSYSRLYPRSQVGKNMDSKEERNKWSDRFQEMAEGYLHVLDPEEFAVTASWAGVSIHPRKWGPETTAWERLTFSSGRNLPADWTGYLCRCLVPPHLRSSSSSPTASSSPNTRPRAGSGKRERVADSSRIRSITRLGSKSVGQSQKGME